MRSVIACDLSRRASHGSDFVRFRAPSRSSTGLVRVIEARRGSARLRRAVASARLEHGALVLALDVQRDEAGTTMRASDRVSRGSPALAAWTGSTIASDAPGRAASARSSRIGKERGGVAVRPHAEHDDVERPGQRLQRRVVATRPHPRRWRPRDRAARSAPPPPRSAADWPRTSAALERGGMLGTKRSSTSVTSTLSQAIGLAEKRGEEVAGVVPPETASTPGRAAAIASRRRPATTAGQRRAPVRSRSAKPCQS